jgi:hypothetical protein
MIAVRRQRGVGKVVLNGVGVWAPWLYESDGGSSRWRVRVSLDEFEALAIHEYQRVRLEFPGQGERSLYFRERRDVPPFVWLEFSLEIRR